MPVPGRGRAGGRLPGARAGDWPAEQGPVRGEQVAAAGAEDQRRGARGATEAVAGTRARHRGPLVAAGGGRVQGRGCAVRREIRAAAGALRPDREHPLARGLQRGDPQPVGPDPRPGLAAVVGGPQLRAERPAVGGVVEADLAHPGRPGGGAADRGPDPVPGGAVVAGARDRRADVPGRGPALAGGAGLAEHEAGVQADERHRGGLEIARGGRQRRGRRRDRARRDGRWRGGRGVLPVPAGRGGVPGGVTAGGRSRPDVQLGDDQAGDRGDDRDHGRRARGGGGRPGHLAAPGPLPDQLERPRRRGQRLHLGLHPRVQVVARVSHLCPPGPHAAGPGPGTGQP